MTDRKPIDDLRLSLALPYAMDDDRRVDTSLDELVTYIGGLEDRIAKLEGGAQNKPFILPERLGPAGNDRPL
jgi:hypothetical protein